MDEQEFKEVYQSVNESRCVFEKAILTRRYGCDYLRKINIAEREAAGCQNPAALQQCQQLLQLLRRNAAFALKLTHISGPLPHAKEIKVQCGGILGLRQALGQPGNESTEPINIHGCLRQALEAFGSLDELPYDEIVKSITHFEGRRRRRK